MRRMQWNPADIEQSRAVRKWVAHINSGGDEATYSYGLRGSPNLFLHTRKGTLTVHPGEWIVHTRDRLFRHVLSIQMEAAP